MVDRKINTTLLSFSDLPHGQSKRALVLADSQCCIRVCVKEARAGDWIPDVICQGFGDFALS
jgi:hypothetical protein